MALYIGTNYHPHDWDAERWKTDIDLMKEAGFNMVRLGHLCWDSYEPEEGVYEFGWFDRVMDLCAEAAPGVPHSSNHYAEKNNLGFDYMKYCDRLDTYPGMGFYPGYQVGEKTHFLMSTYMERLAETDKPMWCLEFQSGSRGLQHGPYGAIRMMAMLCFMRRSQMILGWTWRSMLAGEEQYLCGILGHDGCKTVNYREYSHLASDMKKLEGYAFPYLPVPDIAVAYSYDSDWVIQYAPHHYRQSYRQIMVEVEKAFFAMNRDYNMISPAGRKHDYKVMILPGYTVMSKEDADGIRRFTADGGTVIMTAYSAMVDADGQVFSTPRPGLLDDVFGVRVAGFDRTDSEWNFTAGSRIVEDGQGRHELLKIEAAEPFYIDVDYYEELELAGAESVADFGGKGLCAVSVHPYGRGRAYYLAAETNAELLQWLLESLTDSLDLKRGLSVPEGIQARQIAKNQFFYVNTTAEERKIPLTVSGYGVLGEKQWQKELTLPPYGAELVVA